MKRLQNEGKIQHLITSIYVDIEPSNLKDPKRILVKFGGWDSIAMAPNENLHTHETITQDKWMWNAENFKYQGDTERSFMQGNSRSITVKPSLPYIYIPSGDLSNLMNAYKSDYAGSEIKCDNNDCYFEYDCLNVLTGNRHIEFKINDGYNPVIEYWIYDQHLLVDGSKIGKTSGWCYLSIFENSGSSSEWQLGIPFLQEYYHVLDMQPIENGQGKPYGGFAKKNHNIDIGSIRYNKNYSPYTPLDDDTSVPITPIPSGGGGSTNTTGGGGSTTNTTGGGNSTSNTTGGGNSTSNTTGGGNSTSGNSTDNTNTTGGGNTTTGNNTNST